MRRFQAVFPRKYGLPRSPSRDDPAASTEAAASLLLRDLSITPKIQFSSITAEILQNTRLRLFFDIVRRFDTNFVNYGRNIAKYALAIIRAVFVNYGRNIAKYALAIIRALAEVILGK
jgi:hypothetical protein